jgi:hypothetical protein
MDLERKVVFGEGKKISGRFDREIDFGILWRQALETRRRSQNLGLIRNYLLDAWLGKHRVWLPLNGGLIGVLFFAAGLWILLRTPPLASGWDVGEL